MSLDKKGERRCSRDSKSSSNIQERMTEKESEDKLVILRRKPSADFGSQQDSKISSECCERCVSKVTSVSEDFMSGEPIRMMGYLEKRSKILGWRKYWWVLDGHLLTYYKSKSDYESLAPFAGSVSLGPVATVRPIQINHSNGFHLQILTRNQVIFLRCSDQAVLEEWVLALQETVSIPQNISSPIWSDPGVQFYRYSFAAISDWSLADSGGDISGSLSTLPKNFYLKRERSGSDEKSQLTHKCQSFTNLPTQNPEDSQMRDNIKVKGYEGRIRPANSMLLLESSPQASELKRELARKLSISQLLPSKIREKSTGKFEINNTSGEKVKLRTIGESGTQTGSEEGEDGSNGTNLSKNDGNYVENSSREEGMYKPIQTLPLNLNPKVSGLRLSESQPVSARFESTLHSRPMTLPIQKAQSEGGYPEMGKKKKGIGKFLQKLFKKEPNHIEKEKKLKLERMVISGPVDLRTQRMSNSSIASIASSSYYSPSTPTNQSQYTPVSHKSSLETPTSKTEAVINELKNLQLRRGKSDLGTESFPSKTGTDSSNNQSVNSLSPEEPQNPSVDEVGTDSSTYSEKLAKFNRLSAHLNPSYNGILNTAPSTTSISRSSSCRVKSTNELNNRIQEFQNIPPILPPKKRTKMAEELMYKASAYDTPRNNQPINGHDFLLETSKRTSRELTLVPNDFSTNPRERKISLRELLTKKNSAPEIIFGKEISERNDSRLADFLTQSNEIVPPRPPKPQAKVVENQEVVETNSECLENQSEVIDPCTDSSDLNICVEVEHTSEGEVEKSLDIENIDVLSELSDDVASSFEQEPIYAQIDEERIDGIQTTGENTMKDSIETKIYENMKYATMNTILTELETVEETGDEEDELYDEFVVSPLTHFHIDTDIFTQTSNSPIRCSGIEALETYLDEEYEESGRSAEQNLGGGAINRLGHSSAVKKLQSLLP